MANQAGIWEDEDDDIGLGARPRGGRRGIRAGGGIMHGGGGGRGDGVRGGMRGEGGRGGAARGNRGGGGRGEGRGNRGGDRGGGRGRGRRITGIRDLVEMEKRDPNDIVMTISHPNTDFRATLFKSQDRPNEIRLILRILAKACTCNSMPGHFLNLYTIMKEANFFDTVMIYFMDMQTETQGHIQRTFQQPIKDMIMTLRSLSAQMPNSIVPFIGIHTVLQAVIDKLRETSDVIDEEILTGFTDFTEQKEEMMKRFQRKNAPRDGPRFEDEQPPEDFRDMEIFPTTGDLQIDDGPFLRKNKARGGYDDLNHYLDVQFRLLREDFVGPLRDGISDYITALQARGKAKKIQEVRIYPNVRIIAPVCSDNGLCHVLQFDVSRLGKVKWANTKRLIFGSLVCLSPDNFQNFYFATVANREAKNLEKGIVHVRFEHDHRTVNTLFEKSFTMAETTAYFESYRHILTGLKNTRIGDLPFENYVIKCENQVGTPGYLRRRPDTKFDLRPLVDDDMVLVADTVLKNIGEKVEGKKTYNFSPESAPAENVTLLDRATWPPADLLHLDTSQYDAITTALTKEFAIIQGPPGTGKTYIGLKIVKALLHNRDCWSIHPDTGERDIRPMLVVCYTNHALDQFLEGIIQFFKGDVLRVGGRSSSEILKDFNLNNFRQRYRHAQKVPVAVFQSRREAKDEMDSLRGQININAGKIEIAQTNLLHEDFLQPFMGFGYDLLMEQFEALLAMYPIGRASMDRRHSVIVEWLGLGNLAPVVEMEAREPPQQVQPVPDAENEGLIDADDEVDAMQADRQLDAGEEDDVNLAENALDDIDLLGGDILLSRRQRLDMKHNLEMTRVQSKAVALDVLTYDRKPQEVKDFEWQTQKKQRKKMKQNLQRQLASNQVMSEEEANTAFELWRLNLQDKWRLYRRWVHLYCESLRSDIEDKEAEFENAATRYREALMQEDKEIMRQASVIGMTTTGSARYQAILQEIRPRVIVVEEAAEVLEAHIVTTLNRGCEHLILIGDHKQLKPNPTVYKLATKYNLELSLFERMINNGIKFNCLELQHRMSPLIADLMRPIYPTLRNHAVVETYEDIKGVAHNIFFINHAVEERHDEDLRSHSNEHEAQFIVGLCNYLLLQGYKPSQISVLTMYSGQLFRLRSLMPKCRYDGVRLTVVDNYQGEENDIILLSLVRSNQDGNVGFLKIDNRVCVALSRAKKGLFIIGNFDLLKEQSRLWNEILIDMTKKELLGEALPLHCQNHPDVGGIMVTSPKDFDKAPNGGCDKKCQYRLKCGHRCEMFCHVLDQKHEEYKCKKPCPKVVCAENHRCTRKCSEDCGDCMVLVEKIIKRCGHRQHMPCSKDPQAYVCKENCSHKLTCGHACQAACGNAHTKLCQVEVDHTWPCGHKSRVRCHQKEEALCPHPCFMQLDCDHPCVGTCGECSQGRLHLACQHSCKRVLICGHQCLDNCNNCPPCQRVCETHCNHSRCRERCGDLCVPCSEPCIWRCRHYECRRLCSEPCDRPRCDKPCHKVLKCGHNCIGLCGEPCPTQCRVCQRDEVTQIVFGTEDEADARFVLLEDCKHIIESTAMDTYMDQVDDDGGEIKLKVCPLCKTPIRKCTRYGTIVNKAIHDIEQVKKTMIGNEREIRRLISAIEVKIVDELDGEEKKIMKERLKAAKEWRVERTLVAVDNQLSFLQAILKLERDFSKLTAIRCLEERKRGLQSLGMFKVWVLRKREFMSPQEISDAKMEVSRIEALLQLLLYQQKLLETGIRPDPDVRRQISEAERLVSDGKKYSEDRQAIVKGCLKMLKKLTPLTGLGISQEDKLMILKTMQLAKGHWFKCPKGHIYAIGDCGGATHSGQCPECKSEIGGTAYTLRPGNALAPEMDDARAPAWSDDMNALLGGQVLFQD